MIGLSAAAYGWWERLIAGPGAPGEASPGAPGNGGGPHASPPPRGTAAAPASPGDDLLPFFREMGLFEGEDSADTREGTPALPPHVLWVEAFEPLAFTYSCVSVPGQSYACDQTPSTGPGGGSRHKPTPASRRR